MNELRNNQKNAIEKFKNHYYDDLNTRGILSMCCGSGKTRTFYEIMKLCISEYDEKFFIYTTSRILLVQGVVQEIIEYMYNEVLDLDIDILIKVSEFNFDNIKSNIIIKNRNNKKFDKQKFINFFDSKKKDGNIFKLLGNTYIDSIENRYNKNKKILIITTYESISKTITIISDYNKKNINKKIIPNLLICDESHNLVSSDNDLIIAKTILDESDENGFAPEKYLFMTATPLKIIKRNNNDCFIDDNIVYSMHNEDIYGTVFFEYTFYEGINDKYILDFDVIFLSDIDTNDDKIKNAFELEVNEDKHKKQYCYFHLVAEYLLKTIELYCFKHTLVYLQRQSDVESLNEILKDKLKEKELNYELYSIVSTNSVKDKDKRLENFQTYNNISKILLSVSIFDEGVDIPIIDSILFAQERNSETQIVQNIGRALRIYESKNNNFKIKKAHVIIPTKIYTSENIEESVFSSKFKKIREVCDILREPPLNNNPKYFTRKTKGSGKQFQDDGEITDEKSGLIDDIKKVEDNIIEEKNNKLSMYITEDEKNKYNEISNILIDAWEIKTSSGKLSNIKLCKLKTMMQAKKIINLYEIPIFLEEQNIVIDKLHLNYKNEWLCYGDLLFNKVYTYNESIEVITSLDLHNINSPKEWLEYYNNIINLALKNEFDDLLLLNKLIYIPYDPKTYYLEEWKHNNSDIDSDEIIGWNKFLGKSLENLIGLEIITNSSSINASSNLQNLINQDKEKVKRLLKNEWQTFDILKTNIIILKDYIDSYFLIDCKIELRFMLNNNNTLNKQILNIKIQKFPDNIVPIIINQNYNVKYDKNIFESSLLKSNGVNRTKDFYILNKDVQQTIDNIKNELKEYISNYINNLNNSAVNIII